MGLKRTGTIASLLRLLPFLPLFAFLPASSEALVRPEPPHRRTEPLVRYYVNREANEESLQAIQGAFAVWAGAARFAFVYEGRNEAGLRRDGKNTLSFMARWPAVVPREKMAYCQNWYDASGAIVESDIIFNMEAVRFTTLSLDQEEAFFIEGVALHEIGHLLGLPHSDEAESIMHRRLSRSASGRARLDADTLAAYRRLYGEE